MVVGAGFGGIAAAIELRSHGITDVTILDSAPGSAAPGATTPTRARRATSRATCTRSRSRSAATGRGCARRSPEILEYLQGVAAEYGVGELFVPSAPGRPSGCDEATLTWTVEAEDGRTLGGRRRRAGHGPAAQPGDPARSPGADDFAGPTMHSARWDHEVDLRGKRVAVVGTGASAVQFVPEIAPEVGKMTVFQRTATGSSRARTGPTRGVPHGVPARPGRDARAGGSSSRATASP